jgi:type I restriction enzyme S subunit
MVPDGWHETKLGHLFKSRRARGEAGLPTLSVTLDEGLVRRDSLDRKMDTNLAPEEHLLVRKGDIAYNMMRMWQGASGLADHDALVSPAYVVLEPTGGIDPLFASYFFKTPRMIHLFWAYSHGLTNDRLRLYFDDFSLIPVTVPNLREQTQIANILATWDHAIETIGELVTNAETEKTGLMQKILTGEKRLPGFQGSWHKRVLGNLGSFSKGKGITRDQLVTDGIPCVRYGEIYTHHKDYIRQFYSFISPEIARTSQRIRKGDLLFAGSGETAEEIGKCVAFLGDKEAYAGGDIVIFSPERDDSKFLGYLMNHASIVSQKTRLAQGNAIVHVSASNLSKLRLSLPDPREQQAIVKLFDAVDNTLHNLSNQAHLLRAEKSALMQQLLTGKRRVKNAEEVG